MLRISLHALLITAGALLLSFGLIHLTNGYMQEGDQKVTFSTSISHPSLLGGEKQRTFIKVDLKGFTVDRETERTPVNVAIVLDKSGSMSGEKMEQAKSAALQALSVLGEEDILSIVTYDNGVNVIVPATTVSNRQDVKHKIRSIQASGGTALYAGVVEGANQLREYLHNNRVNRVILLSDGQANEGPSTPHELGELGASLIRDNISVSTIGLGLGYNEDLMVQLALRSDGNHDFVERPDLLAEVFNREFGDVMSVVAQDVKVVIDLQDGIRPIGVQGREANIDGQRVEVELSQLYGDQEKYVLLEVETDDTERSGNQEIAHVGLSYANMITEDTETYSNTIVAHFTDSQDQVEKDIDAETMVSAIEQQAVQLEEQAIELRDAGQTAEAEALFRQNASYLKKNASKFDSDRLSGFATRSEAASMSLDDAEWNRQRKALRSDHYKTKTQQNQ